MNALTLPQFGDVSERWLRVTTSLVRLQGQLLDAHYRTAIELLGPVSGEPAAASAQEKLERYALERARYADDEAEFEHEPPGE
jgi:hypothetical protein